MMGWDWNEAHHASGWMWLWMGAWSLLVIAGIVALVVIGMRAVDRGGAQRGPEEPMDILERRFAAGELDVEEFERRRDTLAKS